MYSVYLCGPRSAEYREKQRQAHLGKTASIEARLKMSSAHKIQRAREAALRNILPLRPVTKF